MFYTHIFTYNKIAFFAHKNQKLVFCGSVHFIIAFYESTDVRYHAILLFQYFRCKNIFSNWSKKLIVWVIWSSAQFILFYVSLVPKEGRVSRSKVQVSTFLSFASLLLGSFLCQRSWMTRLLTNYAAQRIFILLSILHHCMCLHHVFETLKNL